ncbi:MAG: hypothetical protein RJA57_1130 [Bacteroidota bacterium]
MKNASTLLLALIVHALSFAQRQTPSDGDWSQQLLVLRATPEADLMIRIGDIDNLGFGFDEYFDPFSGRTTWSHAFPWKAQPGNAGGTDRIMVPSSFRYGSGKGQDGYCGTTQRGDNRPQPMVMPLASLREVQIDSADLQLYIDDFQSPVFRSRFQVKVNGLRFTEAERLLSRVNQTGPVGKLIRVRLTPELLARLSGDSLVVSIDDPTSGQGDGYAIDFLKLVINPRYVNRGTVTGRVIDAVTREPIAGATVAVEEFGTVVSTADGTFTLGDVPAGLVIVRGSKSGYLSDEKQADAIDGSDLEPVELALRPSQKVTFNQATLQEGDAVVLNNIQFQVNSATLLAPGKLELERLAALLNQHPTMEVQLSGHTSSEGGSTLNRDLSLKRVRSCKDYLVSKGIDDGRIAIRGYGPDQPIAPNDTEANRARNRRVEMRITRL